MENFFLLLCAVIVIGLVVVISIYNGLVTRRNAVHNAFASTDAQLQKRYDLVPNLVATVAGYATHERELLEHVVHLRSAAMQSPDAHTRHSANNQLSTALPQLFAVAENYPTLRASQNFLHLQKSLNEIEEQLAAARRTFNACVTEYNNVVESFPSNIVAGMFGFSKTDWFQISDTERQAPDLKGQF